MLAQFVREINTLADLHFEKLEKAMANLDFEIGAIVCRELIQEFGG